MDNSLQYLAYPLLRSFIDYILIFFKQSRGEYESSIYTVKVTISVSSSILYMSCSISIFLHYIIPAKEEEMEDANYL